jgi:hypothetical protein
MIEGIAQALIIVVLIYILFNLLNSYYPWFYEPFKTFSVPSPTPEISDSMAPPPRIVTPGGPSPPNQRAPKRNAPTVLPPERPSDPLDNIEGPVPIEDTVTHPENSFGPGTRNTGAHIGDASGVASRDTVNAMQTFSPEFAQNGGEFMNGISANSMADAEYALV